MQLETRRRDLRRRVHVGKPAPLVHNRMFHRDEVVIANRPPHTYTELQAQRLANVTQKQEVRMESCTLCFGAAVVDKKQDKAPV